MIESRRVYGLIGHPVSHSLSPSMHNAAFKAFNIDADYRLFDLEEKELGAFLKGMAKGDIYGLNVTIPYKEKVIPYLNDLSPEAVLIGAVNTIKREDDLLKGYNTDGKGFFNHLTLDLKFSLLDKRIVILGAGGAAKAIAVTLVSSGEPGSIEIFDTDRQKAQSLAGNLKTISQKIKIKTADSASSLDIPEADLLINATPMGMKDQDPMPVEPFLLREGILVYDLIYNPAQTKLLKSAEEKGAATANGLGLLLNQGMLSFEIWTGKKPSKQLMEEALRKE